MKYMLLSLVLYFYQLIIFDKVRCTEDRSNKWFTSNKYESESDLLKNYKLESKSIVLENKSLGALSSEISKFKNLKSLCLGYNRFAEIPQVLSEIMTLNLLDMVNNWFKTFPNHVILSSLKTLYLSHNEISFAKLSSGEDSIVNLNVGYPNLESLDLYDNKIRYIPILQSTSLTSLYLRENKIISINPRMFTGLLELEVLDLMYNNLKEINNNIGELQHLEKLYISGNQITTFILKKQCLENLVYMDVCCNKITEFKLKRFIVPKITTLLLSHNDLFAIPVDIYNLKSLEILDLSCNNITEIHDSISNLINLTSLKLSNNKISEIPESISKLTKLNVFTITFDHLDNDYIPHYVIYMITDVNYYGSTYNEYVESQKTIKSV